MKSPSVDDQGQPAEAPEWRGRNLAIPDPKDALGADFVEDETWYFVGRAVDSQGWKVYVSAAVENYRDILNPVIGLLHSLEIPFKYLRSIDQVWRLNSGLVGYSQIGKCIVAYMERIDSVQDLVEGLRTILTDAKHAGPYIPRLPTVWPGASVFYRYGSYVSRSVELCNRSVEDNRDDPIDAEMFGIDNPFLRFGGGRASAIAGASLARYPVIGEFCRSGKGGVFVGLNLAEEVVTEVVVKLGLRNGQALGDGKDASHMLLKESAMYDAVISLGFGRVVPTKIDVISDDCASCLVIEYIDAENMAALRVDGRLTQEMVNDALEMIRELNSRGVVIADAKLANFLHNGNRCWLIDLESAFLRNTDGVLGESGPSTFHIGGVSSDASAFDEIHFLVSCLYGRDDGCTKDEAGRTIDLGEFIDSRKPGDRLGMFALSRLRKMSCAGL